MRIIGWFFQILIYSLRLFRKISERLKRSVGLMKSPETPQSPFTKAVLENDVAFVRAALAHGDDPNRRLLDTPEFDVPEGLLSGPSLHRRHLAPTALIVAAARSYVEMADVLLEFGADLYEKNGYNTLGSTAIHAAASAGHREMVAFLIRRSGLNTIHGSLFETSIMSAAYGGQNAVISLLLQHGADVNVYDDFDTTLTAAATNGHGHTITLLLEQGADANLSSQTGETPLMAAVSMSRFAAVDAERLLAISALIQAGADPNARDNEGRTALWWAKKVQFRALLKAAGAKE